LPALKSASTRSATLSQNDFSARSSVEYFARRLQRRWLALAHSYEFAEQLEFLSAVEARNKEARRLFEDAAA
jgi:hypothetical protein